MKWDDRPGEAWDETNEEQLFLPGWQLADYRHNFELMMAAESPASKDQEAEDLDVPYEVVTMKKETRTGKKNSAGRKGGGGEDYISLSTVTASSTHQGLRTNVQPAQVSTNSPHDCHKAFSKSLIFLFPQCILQYTFWSSFF